MGGISMEIHGDMESRIVEIWLTRGEKNDPKLHERLQDIYDQYKKEKCLVAVFESGEQDLYQSTIDLLRYNRLRLAELAVRKAKQPLAER